MSDSRPSPVPESHKTPAETPMAKANVAQNVTQRPKPSSSISQSRFKAVQPEEAASSEARTPSPSSRPSSDQSDEVQSLYQELDKLADAECGVDELRQRIRRLRRNIGVDTGSWPIVTPKQRDSRH